MTIMKHKETNITNHNAKNVNSCRYLREFKYIKLKTGNNIRILLK